MEIGVLIDGLILALGISLIGTSYYLGRIQLSLYSQGIYKSTKCFSFKRLRIAIDASASNDERLVLYKALFIYRSFIIMFWIEMSLILAMIVHAAVS